MTTQLINSKNFSYNNKFYSEALRETDEPTIPEPEKTFTESQVRELLMALDRELTFGVKLQDAIERLLRTK